MTSPASTCSIVSQQIFQPTLILLTRAHSPFFRWAESLLLKRNKQTIETQWGEQSAKKVNKRGQWVLVSVPLRLISSEYCSIPSFCSPSLSLSPSLNLYFLPTNYFLWNIEESVSDFEDAHSTTSQQNSLCRSVRACCGADDTTLTVYMNVLEADSLHVALVTCREMLHIEDTKSYSHW